MSKLLLTSTIDVNNCSYVKRTNIEDRKNDLSLSLERYLKNISKDIVLVENSNYDLSFLKEKFSDYRDRIEYISFDGNNFPRHLGKGYGEILSILYALKHSKMLQNESHFIKCTGRYNFNNLSSLLQNISIENYDLIAYRRKEDVNLVQTCFYCVNKNIFYDFFIKNISSIDDSKNIYVEHVFLNFFNQVQKKIAILEGLGITGISGTSNEVITWYS